MGIQYRYQPSMDMSQLSQRYLGCKMAQSVSGTNYPKKIHVKMSVCDIQVKNIVPNSPARILAPKTRRQVSRKIKQFGSKNQQRQGIPWGNFTLLLKMAVCSGLTHWKWWFSTVMWRSTRGCDQRVHWRRSKNSYPLVMTNIAMENHGKTIGKWWFNGILWDLPSGND